MKTKVFTAILLLFIQSANSLNILAIYPYNGKSHFIVFKVFLQELANRGHNVTVISHFPQTNPHKNYHDISLAGTIESVEDVEPPMEYSYLGILISGLYLAETSRENCEVLLANKHVQELIKQKPKFDVVVLEQFNSDCGFGIAYKLGAPVVGTTSHVLMPYHYDRLGIPNNPSYVSFHFLSGGTKPNLYQRLERNVLNFYFKTLHYWYSQRSNQKTLAKYFNDVPPLEELAREMKFLLLYQNFVLTGSKIQPANVIEVGGYHVSKAKPLSGDLKKFVEDAKDGVIYISFGTILKTSKMPSEKVEAILEAMKELPQRFIWKWENKTLAVDKNKVYVDSWLPQVDILGHPRTLAFVSHAGMGGTTEALHFGVPVVAMPILGDQPSNAAAIEESGFGIQLHYKDLNKENLVQALRKVLDPKFRQQSKAVSSAWHHRPTSALHTAIFWTEFAARHPTLKFRTAAADVPLYQYLYLDVIAIFVLIIVFVVGAFGLCCRRSKKVGKRDEKRSQQKKPKRQ